MQRANSPTSGRPPHRAHRLRRWVPGVELIQNYPGQSARPDLVAGVVLAAILVPQGMAYAELAGLPAVTGLYTTIACLVGYALFGPSRVLGARARLLDLAPDLRRDHSPAGRGETRARRSRWPACWRSSSA